MGALPRPCNDPSGCGELVKGASRCPAHRIKATKKHHPKSHPHANSYRFQKLSLSVRKTQPWCLDCNATVDLCADHIIPIAERPDLAYERLNLTTRCRRCNGRRADTCTDTERQAVLDAIAARRRRLPASS